MAQEFGGRPYVRMKARAEKKVENQVENRITCAIA